MTAIVLAGELETESTALAVKASEIGKVVDAGTYTRKGELLVAAKALLKAIKDHHRPIKEATNKAHKEACAAENRLADPVEAVIADIDRELVAYRTEQERKRREEELLAQAAERRRAEDALIAEAAAAEAANEPEVAEAILNLEVTTRPVHVAAAVPNVAGLRKRPLRYSARVTNLYALAKAVVEKNVPLQAIQGNQTYLDEKARNDKKTLCWPGVEVDEE